MQKPFRVHKGNLSQEPHFLLVIVGAQNVVLVWPTASRYTASHSVRIGILSSLLVWNKLLKLFLLLSAVSHL